MAVRGNAHTIPQSLISGGGDETGFFNAIAAFKDDLMSRVFDLIGYYYLTCFHRSLRVHTPACIMG